MSIGNEFQADGAETAKALSVNRRRVRGVMKSPLDLERSRLSVHGLHSSLKYNGAVPVPVLARLRPMLASSRLACRGKQITPSPPRVPERATCRRDNVPV